MTEYALFDASSYLDSEEMIAEYLAKPAAPAKKRA